MGNCIRKKSSSVADRESLPRRDSSSIKENKLNKEKRECPFSSNFSSSEDSKINMAIVFEHYQPYEFPLVPIINSHTQRLVRESFKKILDKEYDNDDSPTGKVSGATFFYDAFFKQLFLRLPDFERIFPNIKTRAEIIGKVMSFCLSIHIEELDLVKEKLKGLGAKHANIVHDPWLFGVYTTTIHSTVRLCLGDEATSEIMSAWLHLLAWVMRHMLPEYFERIRFNRFYDGAVNSASAVTEKHREEIKEIGEIKKLKSSLGSKTFSKNRSLNESTDSTLSSDPVNKIKSSPCESQRDGALKSPLHIESSGKESPIPEGGLNRTLTIQRLQSSVQDGSLSSFNPKRYLGQPHQTNSPKIGEKKFFSS